MSDSFDDQMARLRMRFRDRAQTQCVELEGLAGELESGASGARIQEQIRRIAHTLAGTGGIFGFAGISAGAAELEGSVSDVPDSMGQAVACRILVEEIRRTA